MTTTGRTRARRVLLVEGDAAVGETIREQLGAARPNLTLDRVDSGAAALGHLPSTPTDVVIIDHQLVDMTGIALIARIAAMHHPPPVVMISDHADTTAAVEAMKNGAVDYIVKNGAWLQKLPLALDRAVHTARLSHRLRALSEIARAISSTFDVEEVFLTLGDRLQHLVPYERVALKIVEADGMGFDVRSIMRPSPGEPVEVIAGTHAELPVREVLEARQTRVVEVTGDSAERYVIVPIVAGLNAVGALAVGTNAAVHEHDIELLEDLAAHMGIALQNARAYTELKDARVRLVRSEKLEALGEMAAGVAHDFNNILSAILGRAQMLNVRLGADAEIRRSIEVIEQAALDGARTVARIQEFAKAKSEGDFVPVEIDALVRDTVERAQSSLRARHDGIEVGLALGNAGWAVGNASELRQVLTNLIYNAVDAMPDGGCLTIGSGATADGQVWFQVVDTGQGMDETTQARMFNPFFTTKGTRGTGLGLSVSYRIVERHHGHFDVLSALGEGSRVRACLPEHRPLATEDLPEPPARERETGGEMSCRILVIDDDVDVLDVLAEILRTNTHSVVAAHNGAEGLEVFRNSKFDLVFTDLGMPGMNGWEVAAGVKALSPSTPVGLITGWGANVDEKRMKEAGVDLIVSKPFRFDEVVALVEEAVKLKVRLEADG